VPCLWPSIHLDFGLGLGASADHGEAAPARPVRTGPYRSTGSGSASTTSAASRGRCYRRLSACCTSAEQLRDPFEAAIERDETTFEVTRKGKRGWGAAGKVIVLGLVKRNGGGKAMPIPAHDRVSIMRRDRRARARRRPVLHRPMAGVCDSEAARRARDDPQGRDAGTSTISVTAGRCQRAGRNGCRACRRHRKRSGRSCSCGLGLGFFSC
jgi:hypothetical protein